MCVCGVQGVNLSDEQIKAVGSIELNKDAFQVSLDLFKFARYVHIARYRPSPTYVQYIIFMLCQCRQW